MLFPLHRSSKLCPAERLKVAAGFWKRPLSITCVMMEWTFGEESVESLSFSLGILGFTLLLAGLILLSPGSFGRLFFAGWPIATPREKENKQWDISGF